VQEISFFSYKPPFGFVFPVFALALHTEKSVDISPRYTILIQNRFIGKRLRWQLKEKV
jgi:hypothetical protein